MATLRCVRRSGLTRAPQSNVLNIYMAHRDWNWAIKEDPAGGRLSLPAVRLARALGCMYIAPRCAEYGDAQGHANAVRDVLSEMLAAQCDVLLAPNVGRSRHLLTEGGASPPQPARLLRAADGVPSRREGRRKRSRVQQYKAERHVRITLACTRLSAAVEEMKTGERSCRARHARTACGGARLTHL